MGSAELQKACDEDSYDDVWLQLEADPSLASSELATECSANGKAAAALALTEHMQVEQLKAAHPSVSSVDARRFLRARAPDLKKAEALLAADVAWRKEGVDGMEKGQKVKPSEVTAEHIPIALSTGCWRMLGTTTANYPVLWIQVALWHPGIYSLEEYVRYVVFFLERMCKIGDPDKARFVVLFDMGGWRFSHALQLRKVAALIRTLQEHYPERLEAARLFHTPSIFNAAWKVIKPWVDPVTVAKVQFIAGGQEKAALEAVGLPSTLVPTLYGGPIELDAIPVPNIPGEPNVTVVKH